MSAEQTVFVVDDDAGLRESLASLLRSAELPARFFSSAEEFLSALRPNDHGCVLLDMEMPGVSGLELIEALRRPGFSMPIIVLTGHADVPMTVRAFRNGVMDLLEKPVRAPLLLDRIRAALAEGGEAIRLQQQRAELHQRIARLTRRERQVFDLLVLGRSVKEIATELSLSPKTIQIHRTHLLAKLSVQSVAELVRVTEVLRTHPGRESPLSPGER